MKEEKEKLTNEATAENDVVAEDRATEQQEAVADEGEDTRTGSARSILLFVDENMPELKDAAEEEKFEAVAELLEKNRIFHEKMEALFESEPLLGSLMSSIMQDEKPFLVAMAELMSPDEYSELLEHEGSDVVKTRNDRLKKLKEIEDRESSTSANVETSGQNISAWLDAKTDWDDAKKQDFGDKVSAIFGMLADGKLTNAELDQFARMIYFDDEIQRAKDEGIVVGRNEQIDAKRLQNKIKNSSDGLPPLAGGGTAGLREEKPAPYNPFADVIEMHKKKIF